MVDSCRNSMGSVFVAFGENYRELISAHTRHGVDRAARSSQCIRYPAQRMIADHVTETVVD
jgi:hypothetical protein